jgi:ElaB/YqjD/DUF883 family membrane-anchored ribosome-binding protein
MNKQRPRIAQASRRKTVPARTPKARRDVSQANAASDKFIRYVKENPLTVVGFVAAAVAMGWAMKR